MKVEKKKRNKIKQHTVGTVCADAFALKEELSWDEFFYGKKM